MKGIIRKKLGALLLSAPLVVNSSFAQGNNSDYITENVNGVVMSYIPCEVGKPSFTLREFKFDKLKGYTFFDKNCDGRVDGLYSRVNAGRGADDLALVVGESLYKDFQEQKFGNFLREFESTLYGLGDLSEDAINSSEEWEKKYMELMKDF